MPTRESESTTTYREILTRLDALLADSKDPTPNVLGLVEAAMQRQDDLRKADRAEVLEIRRIKEDCAKETDQLREKLREAESARINAIRAVDVAAAALANERGTQQASVLASQVSTSAETLRAMVATTAEAVAKTFAATVSQLSDRVTLLEKSQYQIGGRDLQRGESRGQSNWLTGVIIVIGVAIVQVLLKLFGQ